MKETMDCHDEAMQVFSKKRGTRLAVLRKKMSMQLLH